MIYLFLILAVLAFIFVLLITDGDITPKGVVLGIIGTVILYTFILLI